MWQYWIWKSSSLKRRGLELSTSFFCTISWRIAHRLIKCPTTHIIWKYLLDIQQVLNLLLFEASTMVFFFDVQNGPSWQHGDIVPFLQYWDCNTIGMCVKLSRLIVEMGWKPIWRNWKYYVKFLDVRTCGDHFIKCVFRSSNGFTRCLSPCTSRLRRLKSCNNFK